jgi:hypothetical protein
MQWAISIAWVAVLAGVLQAQTTASIVGRVTDPDGAAVGQAVVTLENIIARYRHDTLTAEDGSFAIANIALQDYTLTIQKPGFQVLKQPVSLRTNVRVEVTASMRLADITEEIAVTAYETSELVDVEATGTRTALSQSAMERMPVQVGTRGIESVLLTFPGFAPNANGAIHPRGAHNQMTFLVDGLPISDQLTGAFASSLDPNIVQTIELFTGNIPAEFGAKVSGVANIITRTGYGTGRRFSGSSEFSAAQFGTTSNVTQFAGETGRFGYFGSVFMLKSNRYLDQVSLDNLHNGGNTERGYVRVDYHVSDRDVFRFHAMSGRSSFELANLRSQHAAGQDQRQLLRDSSFWTAWVRTLSPRATLETVGAYRRSTADLYSSPGDTPVTADQSRSLGTATFNTRLSYVAGRQTWRAGADYQHIPIQERFSFGITDPSFNDPADDGYRESLLAYDLTRGGSRFSFLDRRGGNLYSGFAQDEIKLGPLVMSLGARYDTYRFLVSGSQFQPRVGLAYHVKHTGTVFRASYNRNYQTPPNENLLLSSSEQAAQLAPDSVREALGGAVVRIRPERQNVYEAGLQQALFKRMSLNVSYYYKNSSDQQDNDNFLNTGIIFPTTLAAIRVNGAEVRLNVPAIRGFSGSFSLTHGRAISTPPFTGGLFLSQGAVDLLSAGPFRIDHDQKLGLQGNLLYRSKKNYWLSSAVRYDSGLVSNPSDPAQVAADPDFFDLLPYVDLESAPTRVRPRTVVDLAAGYEKVREGRRLWDAQLQVTNLTNRTALYNFQSIFVGTRLVQPRTAGVKFRFYW